MTEVAQYCRDKQPIMISRKIACGLLWFSSLIVFWYSPALALTGDLTNDASDIVKKYVLLDKQGVRLQAFSYESIRPYIYWEQEPAWGQVVVIKDYTVNDDVRDWKILSSTEAIIPVTFQIIGIMHWEAATFLSEPRKETIEFHVKAELNHWRIIAPMFPPHVGRKRLINFVRGAILEENDENKKSVLEHLKTSLGNAKS